MGTVTNNSSQTIKTCAGPRRSVEGWDGFTIMDTATSLTVFTPHIWLQKRNVMRLEVTWLMCWTLTRTTSSSPSSTWSIPRTELTIGSVAWTPIVTRDSNGCQVPQWSSETSRTTKNQRETHSFT